MYSCILAVSITVLLFHIYVRGNDETFHHKAYSFSNRTSFLPCLGSSIMVLKEPFRAYDTVMPRRLKHRIINDSDSSDSHADIQRFA